MPQKYSTIVYKRDIPWWAYDIAIFMGLLGFGWIALAVHWIFWVVPAVLIWGGFIEPRLLTVRRDEIGEGERTMRIVFLSDLHVGPYKGVRWLRRVVQKVNIMKPDLVLLGGDLLYHEKKDLPKIEPLSDLRAPYGVHAILGNHDERFGGEDTRVLLETCGVTVLRNASAEFVAGDHRVAVVGVVDDWYAETDLERSFEGAENADTVIAMVHNPDLAPHAAKYAPDLMLSGHTHGGQIRLPFIGPVPPLPHHLGRTYDRGRFDMNGLPYIIGQGLGESGPRARLFCPPQIIEVSLRY